jgi:O-antigen chain-terminating methyltransferase
VSDAFYRAFEERLRGSRELINSRLGVYLPFVQPLLIVHDDAKAIDLGCGRGEWLELISGLGFDALGVDLDQGMLDAAHQLGLKVEKGDAIGFISALEDESQSVVSAFHVVEHVTFEQLRTLVSQALRVLKPGGLLIMETPNPENLLVATKNFYLDPTHQRPIPPELLSFIPEYYGFVRTKILRLQESKELVTRSDLTLQDVFGGASPDYAVVAQKAAAENFISLLDTPFSLEYGLSLENLTGRYQDQISARFQQAESKAQQAESKAQQAESKAQQAESKAQQAEAVSNERLAQLQAVYASSSWRLTKPLRAIKRIFGGDFSIFGRSTAAVTLKARQVRGLARANATNYVFNQPKLINAFNLALKSLPWLHDAAPKLQSMTPHARHIFADLKAAVDRKKQENR